MNTKRTLLTGHPGTKKYIEKYGKDLVCVRYKYSHKERIRYTTVELVIDKSTIRQYRQPISGNKIMPLKVGYEEIYIRKLVKQAGRKWNKDKRIWELPYRDTKELGLESRMVLEYDKNVGK
jgi:hypothetical protein